MSVISEVSYLTLSLSLTFALLANSLDSTAVTTRKAAEIILIIYILILVRLKFLIVRVGLA